jgi:NitT/TauT family transport system substrate-binding protein
MKRLTLLLAALLMLATQSVGLAAEKLKIAYSDWPGWVAWEVAIQKGWFKEAGVEVEFVWLEYVPSMDAFSAGKVDAVCVTNGDAMVMGATGKKSTCIVINDYSYGNDMIVAKPGIRKVSDLKGKKIGVELNFVDHLLLLKALESAGLKESDVTLVNMATNDTPQAMASGGVDAIAAWQPNSGQALKQVPGSKAIYSSMDIPGLIYDGLYVSRESLAKNKAEWTKVAAVWFKCVEYIKNPKTQPDALKTMAARVQITPDEYAKLLDGTFLLDLPGNVKAYTAGDSLESIYGSSAMVDKFNMKHEVYKDAQDVKSYLDPSIITELAKKK